jgi:anti-sigma-K factor RskA
MSGFSATSDAEDRAGLYVLGALNAEEMRNVRSDAEREPTLAAEIIAWEKRLFPLVALVPAVPVPDTLWPALELRLNRLLNASPAAIGQIYQAPLRQRSRRRGEQRALIAWRATAFGAMALAASLAIIMLTRSPPPPPVLAMIMPAQPGLGGWLVSVKPDGEIHAVAQGALSHTLSQDFELWALADGASKPIPLGLLPQTNGTVLKTAALPQQKFKLLVSLEPKGGSPTGLPTGPVLFASQPLNFAKL